MLFQEEIGVFIWDESIEKIVADIFKLEELFYKKNYNFI